MLITGNKGFVGSHIQDALEADGYEIVGLEAKPTFREWYDEMYAVMDTPIDAVIHAGAISDNQFKGPDIYLWNAYATFLLAQRTRQKMDSLSPMPFIFFSSFLVRSTLDKWETRTPYAWSKAQAENYVNVYLPHATILRPGVMWGDERCKASHKGSLPFRLASHSLEYLFKNWERYYVYVSDVIEAVKLCLEHRPKGVYDLVAEYVTNEEISKMISWDGYRWLDDPRESGITYISEHRDEPLNPMPPWWKPKAKIETELPRLERKLNG